MFPSQLDDEVMNFSFDDLYSYRFMYDSDNKKLEISFHSYYAKDINTAVERNCVLSICDWTSAKGKMSEDSRWSSDINPFIGVVDMILSMNEEEDGDGSYLTMTVMTNDDRYVDWRFANAKVEIMVE